MNDPTPEIPPMPTNFGMCYALWMLWWLVWKNAITILQTAQLIALYIQTQGEQAAGGFVSPAMFHAIVAANTILSIILAQIKRTKPAILTKEPLP